MVWNKWPFKRDKADQQDNNPQQQPQQESRTFFRSYSSSRTCKPDPNDNSFMICKEKVQDGNNVYEKEERIPQQSNASNNHSPFGNNFNDQINREFQGFANDLKNIPFFGGVFPNSLFSNINFSFPEAFREFQESNYPKENYRQAYRQSSNKTQTQADNNQKAPQQNSRYYFSKNTEQDYSIKDL